MSTTRPNGREQLIFPDVPPEFTFARQIDKHDKQWRIVLINTQTQEKFWSDWFHRGQADYYRVNRIMVGLVDKMRADQKSLEILAEFPDWQTL